MNEQPPSLTQEPTELSEQPVSEIKSSYKKKWLLIILAIILIGFGLVTSVYRASPTDPYVRRISAWLPLPALTVDDETITIKDYLYEYDALTNYFASLEDGTQPSPEDLQETIMQTLTNKLAIQNLADAYNVKLDPVRVEQYYQDVMTSQPSEEAFAEELQKTFGWTTEEFKAQILESVVLTLQVSESIAANEEIQSERRTAIEAAHERLVNEEDRATVAKDVQEQFAVPFGGDLGYLPMEELSTEFGQAIALLQVGQFSEVIPTPEGYTILTLLDRIETVEQTQVQLFAIAIPKKNLEDVVKAYLETAKIKQYI